jgi:hypothetical protein
MNAERVCKLRNGVKTFKMHKILNFGLSSTFHIFFASSEFYQLKREQDVLGHDESVHVSCYDDVLFPHKLQLKRQQPEHQTQLKIDK